MGIGVGWEVGGLYVEVDICMGGRVWGVRGCVCKFDGGVGVSGCT